MNFYLKKEERDGTGFNFPAFKRDGSGFDFPVRPCMAISLLVAGQSAASISWKPSRDMGEVYFFGNACAFSRRKAVSVPTSVIGGLGAPWRPAILLGTADDFSNLKVLQRNLDYRKKELFSFLTQQILARSVKKRRSYSRSKSSGLENNLSPSLREKSRFDRHNRLDFPPWQRFTCILWQCTTGGHGRCMQRSTKADLLFTSTLFLVCLDATRKESCPERSRLVLCIEYKPRPRDYGKYNLEIKNLGRILFKWMLIKTDRGSTTYFRERLSWRYCLPTAAASTPASICRTPASICRTPASS